MTALFTRSGVERKADGLNDKGQPFYRYQMSCSRCGGAGGSDKWAMTGWTCFDCGGSGRGPVRHDRLYTAEKLAKLNAAAEKRNAAKTAKRNAELARIEVERSASRGKFVEEHAKLFVAANALQDEFCDEMIRECINKARISLPQIELLQRKIDEAKARGASTFVGEVGQRIDFDVTIDKVLDWSNTSGFPKIYRYCHLMRSGGNRIKYIGSVILGQPGDSLKIKATIAEHEEYKGEKQTIIKRPKEIE